MRSRFTSVFSAVILAGVVSGCALKALASTETQVVEVRDNQLVIDGEKQPQLFGAEIQYFRLRGGQGRNIPRAKVIELWNKALDRAVEAGMNFVSFYIPRFFLAQDLSGLGSVN